MSRKRTPSTTGSACSSAMDNRPLREVGRVHRAQDRPSTCRPPGPYELERSDGVVEQIIRPTASSTCSSSSSSTEGQIDDLLRQVRVRVERDERVLVTTPHEEDGRGAHDVSTPSAASRSSTCTPTSTPCAALSCCASCAWAPSTCLVGINLLREGLTRPRSPRRF